MNHWAQVVLCINGEGVLNINKVSKEAMICNHPDSSFLSKLNVKLQ